MFSSGATKSKVDLLEASRMLAEKGYEIYPLKYGPLAV